MKKILFVCHGNICRSTMAECVFNDILERNSEKSISCDSAATSTEEIGNPVHYGTRNVLQRHGIPVGNHRARQITLQDYSDYDYFIFYINGIFIRIRNNITKRTCYYWNYNCYIICCTWINI